MLTFKNLAPKICLFATLISVQLMPALPVSAQKADDPLPSWNEGASKKSIIDFVARVTKEGGPDYVSPERRIATFDNDGTLWTEKPIYTEVAFALDRILAMAPQHPEWKTEQPFAAVLNHDLEAVAKSGDKGIVQLMVATHCDMTTEHFRKLVIDWIAQAKQPRFKRPYTECIYQPMLEVLALLRARGFKTYIATSNSCFWQFGW